MKAEELGLGNYIEIDGVCWRITEIRSGGFITAVCSTGYQVRVPLEGVMPIAITADWLVRLGLKTRYRNRHYSIYRFGRSAFGLTFDYAKEDDKFNITFEGNQMKTVCYVHEVQNFYRILLR